LAAQLSERESRQLSAQAYYNLGHISTRRGDMNQAVDHCKQSVAIYQEIDDVVGQARAFNNLAIAYTDQGDYPSAESALQKSLAINKRIGNIQEQGFIANNLGNIYLYRGDYQTALQLYQESNAIWQRIGAELPEAVVTSNLAQVYIYEADLDNAKQALTHSESLFAAIGSQDFLPELERRWAEYYLGTGDDEKALAKVESSLAIARKNDARLDEGITLRICGEVYRGRAEYTQSETAFEESIALLQELDSEYEAARSVLALESLAGELGRPLNRTRLNEAAATFTKLGAQIELRKASQLIEDQK
jgi:tetratricopeptide (TPR) repeat protein